MVLAEAKHIAGKKRISLDFGEILKRITEDPRCLVLPMDIFVLAHMSTDLDIHDSIIVATALHCQEFFAEEVVLLTTDEMIRTSGQIKTLW